MEFIRIPVSLKVDIDSDFYKDFILPLREDRRLSDFIEKLLLAYYEDDGIKELVDNRIMASSSASFIREQLERIHMEHLKNIMTTKMLKQQVEKTKMFVEGAIAGDEGDIEIKLLSRVSEVGEGKEVETGLNERLSALERAIPDIYSKLDAVLDLLKKNVVNSEVEEVIISNGGVKEFDDSLSIEKDKKLEVENELIKIDLPVSNENEKNIPSLGIMGNEIGENKETVGGLVIVDDSSDEDKPSKPTSFSKAFKSTLKK